MCMSLYRLQLKIFDFRNIPYLFQMLTYAVNQNLSQICVPKLRYYSEKLNSAQILFRKTGEKIAYQGNGPATKSDEFLERGGGAFSIQNLCCRFWEL